jgi:hypothetical protein
MKRFVGVVIVIMVLLGINSAPDQWADVAAAIGNKAAEIATNIGVFLHELFT